MESDGRSSDPSLSKLCERISAFNACNYKVRVFEPFWTKGEAECLRVFLASRSVKDGYIVSARIAILDADIPQELSAKVEVHLVGQSQRIEVLGKGTFVQPEQVNMTVCLALRANT